MTRTRLLRIVAELADPNCGQPLSSYACVIICRLGYEDFLEEFKSTFFNAKCCGFRGSDYSWWSYDSEERPLALLFFAEYYRSNNKPLTFHEDETVHYYRKNIPPHLEKQLPPISQ